MAPLLEVLGPLGPFYGLVDVGASPNPCLGHHRLPAVVDCSSNHDLVFAEKSTQYWIEQSQ